MFQVFSRVGSFIDVFVEGDFIIKLLSTPVTSELYDNIADNPNVIIYRESTDRSDITTSSFWTYRSKWNVINTGNIAVTGHVSFDQHSR